MDGRNNSFRPSAGEHTTVLSPDTRRDTRTTAPLSTRTASSPRQDGADGAAAPVRVTDGNRLPPTARLRSTRDAAASDRRAPSFSSHPSSVSRADPRNSEAHMPPSTRRAIDLHHTVDRYEPRLTSFAPAASRPSHTYESPRYASGTHSPYQHHRRDTYRPAWCRTIGYPVSFGLAWSSYGSYAFAVTPYAPGYASYTCTPYYDSWSYGNWGCSYAYYGGWRHGWYGGFSYVYNPWPVYSTCYFYDAPVVTRVETVYVTQPAAETAVYESALPTAPAVDHVAAQTVEAAIPTPAQTAVPETPAGESVNAFVLDDPFSDFGYATAPEDFTLHFVSYAESLDAEMIGASYAGFDRMDSDVLVHLDEETASIPSL